MENQVLFAGITEPLAKMMKLMQRISTERTTAEPKKIQPVITDNVMDRIPFLPAS